MKDFIEDKLVDAKSMKCSWIMVERKGKIQVPRTCTLPDKDRIVRALNNFQVYGPEEEINLLCKLFNSFFTGLDVFQKQNLKILKPLPGIKKIDWKTVKHTVQQTIKQPKDQIPLRGQRIFLVTQDFTTHMDNLGICFIIGCENEKELLETQVEEKRKKSPADLILGLFDLQFSIKAMKSSFILTPDQLNQKDETCWVKLGNLSKYFAQAIPPDV